MIRQTLIQSIKPALRSPIRATRTISYTAVRHAEGDTGGTRSGGAASSDAFTKRENAQEAMYMQQKEKEKLEAIRERLKEHRKQVDSLDKHVDETLKDVSEEPKK